jgi:DNA repair protein RadC
MKKDIPIVYRHPLEQIPLVKEPNVATYLKSPENIFPFCDDLTKLPQEGFFTIIVDAKNRIIERRMITWGTLDSTLVHPREVYRYAIMQNAHSIILVHNHPSGDITPSAEDIRITRQLVEAGKVLGLKVLDHIVVGYQHSSGNVKSSIRESGVIDFG